ncbi:MAG: MarR family transcriptional regulator [Xanthomonadales bacterium]|nr:MarR family transcriptional regulator [Xanthomonadales bacterium]
MTVKSQGDPMMFRFFTELGIIDQLSKARLESVLPGDMKMSHFILVHHLERLGGQWSPARLANALQVTRAAITNTVTRLEAQGLVRVDPDPADGRGKLVSLTEAGRDMRNEGIRRIAPFMGELQRQIGEDSFATALPLLEEIRRFLDEHR